MGVVYWSNKIYANKSKRENLKKTKSDLSY